MRAAIRHAVLRKSSRGGSASPSQDGKPSHRQGGMGIMGEDPPPFHPLFLPLGLPLPLPQVILATHGQGKEAGHTGAR